MSVAVLTHKDAPFQLHMGITRGISFLLSKEQQKHKGLALNLHQFAIGALRQMGYQKHYVITTPLDRMAKIFKDKLPEHTWKAIPMSGGRDFLSDAPYSCSSNWLSQHGDCFDEDFCFQLFRQNQVIFRVNNKAQEEAFADAHSWFFCNTHTATCPYFMIDIEGLLQE